MRHGPLWNSVFFTALLRMTVAGAVMTAAGYAAHTRVAALWPADTGAAQLASVAALLAACAVGYLGACHVLRVDELGDFASLLRRKRRGKRT